MRQNFLVPTSKIIAVLILLIGDVCEAQPLNKAVGNAYIITRMAEKFHVQPRPVNDTFSNDLFNRLLNDLDEERIYFNRQDIARLSAYSLQLDDQVKEKLISSNYLSRSTKGACSRQIR